MEYIIIEELYSEVPQVMKDYFFVQIFSDYKEAKKFIADNEIGNASIVAVCSDDRHHLI
ncbi:MAG: hypothetical protein LBN27_12160 [Prevotellaceae bacterium]|jgi:hypothetical protein|nr:hypothetical protein [Prevotellaceae bacterium]